MSSRLAQVDVIESVGRCVADLSNSELLLALRAFHPKKSSSLEAGERLHTELTRDPES